MTSQEKLVLSGSLYSRHFLSAVMELSGVDNPNILMDRSARHDENTFDGSKVTMEKFFSVYGISRYSWLQHSFDEKVSTLEAAEKIGEADVLFVLGGSTRRVYRKWQEMGVTDLIKQRVAGGEMVGCGGSAGAMIWFENGYSDSNQYEVAPGARWEYSIVPGVETIPAWVTAHYSDTDEFGRLRSEGFRQSLRRHEGEWGVAIGLETYATLICSNGLARVIDIRGTDIENPHTAYVIPSDSHMRPRPMTPDAVLDLSGFDEL